MSLVVQLNFKVILINSAPEQFESEGSSPYLADLWSLGITYYLFLYEDLPYSGDSEIELQMNIINKNVVYPEYADNETITFINKLLNKNTKERIIDLNYFS